MHLVGTSPALKQINYNRKEKIIMFFRMRGEYFD